MQKDDVIDRQAAISALGEEPEVWMDDDDYTLGQRNQWRYDVTALKAVPSAQPEIIYCKDCRHNCNCEIQYHAQAGDMFFCGAGERRTDDVNVIT